jgi:hypothetical protein
MERDWPEGRGIFHNKDKTFLTWVNEEDQLRIISMQEGGDVRAVFDRLARGIQVSRNFVYIWLAIYHVLTFLVPLLRIREYDPGRGSVFFPSRIPGSKKHRIRNTVLYSTYSGMSGRVTLILLG